MEIENGKEKELEPIRIKMFLWFLVIVVTLLNLFFIGNARNTFISEEKRLEEAAKPSEFSLIYIKDENCTDCFEIELVEKEIENLEGIVKEKESLDLNSKRGAAFIEKYNITKLPTVLIEGDLDKEPELVSLWPQIGRIEEDVFVLEDVQAPYIDLETNEKRGVFELTFLTDQSCGSCYDVTLHQNALEGLAMRTENLNQVDISSEEGKTLLQKYSIEKVPTILVSGDVAVYDAFAQVWPQVGTNEEDNVYVFREVGQMGAYKDLTTGKIIDSE